LLRVFQQGLRITFADAYKILASKWFLFFENVYVLLKTASLIFQPAINKKHCC